jgi:hypothetical protein
MIGSDRLKIAWKAYRSSSTGNQYGKNKDITRVKPVVATILGIKLVFGSLEKCPLWR